LEELKKVFETELSLIDRKKTIYRLRNEGNSYEEIGRIFNISRQRVQKIVEEGGQVTKGNKKKDKIISLYLQGLSRHQIALKMKCSVNTVTAQLKKAGMAIRDGRRK